MGIMAFEDDIFRRRMGGLVSDTPTAHIALEFARNEKRKKEKNENEQCWFRLEVSSIILFGG